MSRVTHEEVVRHWLCQERRKPEGSDVDADATLDADAALDALLRAKPGAARFLFTDAPIEWFRVELDARSVGRLRVIKGPERMLWNALSPDGTVLGAARRVANGDPDRLEAETGVDVGRVLDLRRRFGVTTPAPALVVSTRRGRVPWTVADGNHRATARMLSTLVDDTGDDEAAPADDLTPAVVGFRTDGAGFAPQPAYVGVGVNPVLAPLRERVAGAVDRLLGRDPRRPP